jgi:hypothetical protein
MSKSAECPGLCALGQIFISHSGKDRDILDEILQSFSGTGVEPVLMEERLHNGEPNWLWIKREIQKSDALFVILSRGLVAQEHTQNWVAFEIGVAAGCEPPKPVFVITGESVRFPVPYLDHYFPYSMTVKTPRFAGVPDSEWKGAIDGVMKQYIRNPRHSPEMDRVSCRGCRVSFYAHGSEREFNCPCCAQKMN